MKLKINLLVFLLPLGLCILSGCAGSRQPIDTSRKYSPEELKEDLDFLLQTYEQVHPNLYRNISKNVIDSIHAQVQGEFDSSMTSFEFSKLVSPVVSKFGDGHSSLNIPFEFRQKYLKEEGKIIPFEARIDGNRLFVRQNYSRDSMLSPGAEILTINDIPAKEVLINLRKYKPGETIGFVNDYVQRLFKPLIWTRYGFGDNFKLEFISAADSVLYLKSFSGITFATYDSLIQKNDSTSQPFETWTFRKLKDENIAIIDINIFGYPDGLDKFKKFLDSSFTIMKHQNIENLIIDIRGNGGGDNIIGESLIDYLATEPWVLSSKFTAKFSSQLKAEYIPWWLRWIPVKTFIGMFSFFVYHDGYRRYRFGI